MAAALARSVHGIEADSAGIAPGTSATRDAIAVVRARTGIDISGHQPREIERSQLAAYDVIIAMDSYVADRLRVDYSVADSQLTKWQINDPYLKGRWEYEHCADTIAAALGRITPTLAPSAKTPCPSEGPILGEAATSRPALRSDLARWQCELQAGQIRDTLLQGIVKKAVDSFEVIVRRSAATMRPLAEESSAIPAKPFELLTLGQLIQYLAQHNKSFTAIARSTVQGAVLFRERRLISSSLRTLLDKISVLRNELHHRPESFASDAETLKDKSRHLLTLLSTALEDPLFDFIEALDRGHSLGVGR